LGHSVFAITFDAQDAEPFFGLDQRVKQHHANALNRAASLPGRIAVNFRRLWRLRSFIKALRPDAIVAFMTEASVLTVVAAAGLGIPVVVTERNQPDRPGLGTFPRLARRLCYPWAGALIVQTDEIARWARARFRLPVHVLPNPVKNANVQPDAQDGEAPLIVAAGRLVHQKGFDILIESFAKVAENHPDWQLVIYGIGPEQTELEALIKRRSLDGRVSLAGLTNDIEAVLRCAKIFVLPSRFEGYPNVLLEALSLGCPVIATECPGATRQILNEGRHGVLVPAEDVKALAEALDRMMSDTPLRAHYGAQGPQAVAHLRLEAVGATWLEILESITKDK
jgi:glycosyltransferase involved in cell wall biosynthesis